MIMAWPLLGRMVGRLDFEEVPILIGKNGREVGGLGLVESETLLYGVNAPGEEGGSPSYSRAFPKTVYVHFESEEDVEEFSRLIGRRITSQTRLIWYYRPRRKGGDDED